MELKYVYKKTPIGMIPEEWSVLKMGELATIQRGASPRPIDSPIWFDAKSSIGWLRISDITKSSKYLTQTSQGLSNKGVENSRLVKAGNLVMSICATVGRPILLCKDVCIHDGFVVFNNLGLDKEYLYYILVSIERNWGNHGQTGSQMNLNTGLINSTPIPVPPIQEQTVIAKGLSDADAWIQSLTQLIAKKRQIKQGAMRELLSPKDNWLEKKLKDVAILKARIGWQGLTTAEYLSSGNYYLVTGTEFKDGCIDWGSCYYVDEERYKQDKNIQLQQEDVLVTKDGTIGKVAYISTFDKPATLNSGVFVIRPKKGGAFDPLFFYYILCSQYFSTFLNQLSAGSTINHLYQKDFVNFSFKSPSSLGEQKSIASVLSDMDNEIFELERKLEKAKQIKQGMMQNLLTGRIRLI